MGTIYTKSLVGVNLWTYASEGQTYLSFTLPAALDGTSPFSFGWIGAPYPGVTDYFLSCYDNAGLSEGGYQIAPTAALGSPLQYRTRMDDSSDLDVDLLNNAAVDGPAMIGKTLMIVGVYDGTDTLLYVSGSSDTATPAPMTAPMAAVNALTVHASHWTSAFFMHEADMSAAQVFNLMLGVQQYGLLHPTTPIGAGTFELDYVWDVRTLISTQGSYATAGATTPVPNDGSYRNKRLIPAGTWTSQGAAATPIDITIADPIALYSTGSFYQQCRELPNLII